MDKFRLKSSALKAQIITLEAQRAQKEEAGDERQPVDLEALKIEGVHRAEKARALPAKRGHRAWRCVYCPGCQTNCPGSDAWCHAPQVEDRNAELLRLKSSAGHIQKVRTRCRRRLLEGVLLAVASLSAPPPEHHSSSAPAIISTGCDADQEGASRHRRRVQRSQGGQVASREADGGVGGAAAEPGTLQGGGAPQVSHARAQRHRGQAAGAGQKLPDPAGRTL